MIDSSAIAAVFSVYLVGVLTPGPNFVAVVHKAVSGRRSDALAVVAGIVVVNLFWATCTILGIGIVFTTFPWLGTSVKLAGAGYFIWFGMRIITSSGRRGTVPLQPSCPTGVRPAFVQGVATNIANPKSVAFYAAVFSTAAPTHVSVPTFLAMIGTVGVTSACWYGAVALLLSRSEIALAYSRAKKWVDRTCGALIIALGITHIV